MYAVTLAVRTWAIWGRSRIILGILIVSAIVGHFYLGILLLISYKASLGWPCSCCNNGSARHIYQMYVVVRFIDPLFNPNGHCWKAPTAVSETIKKFCPAFVDSGVGNMWVVPYLMTIMYELGQCFVFLILPVRLTRYFSHYRPFSHQNLLVEAKNTECTPPACPPNAVYGWCGICPGIAIRRTNSC